jgi:hypothetical protein
VSFQNESSQRLADGLAGPGAGTSLARDRKDNQDDLFIDEVA